MRLPLPPIGILRLTQSLEHLIGRVLNAISLFAGALLFLMAVIVTTDVLKRWLTGKPINGVFESVEVMLVAVIMGVLGLVEWQHRQLNVDVFTHRARGRLALGFLVLDKGLALLFIGVLLAMACTEWLKAWNGWYLGRGLVAIPIVVPMGFIVVGAALCWIAAAWGFGKGIACIVTGGKYRVPQSETEIGGAASGPAVGSH